VFDLLLRSSWPTPKKNFASPISPVKRGGGVWA